MKTSAIAPLRVKLSSARVVRRLKHRQVDGAEYRRQWRARVAALPEAERRSRSHPLPAAEAVHEAITRKMIRDERLRAARVRVVRLWSPRDGACRYYLSYGRRVDRRDPGTGGFTSRREAEHWFTRDGR